MSTPQPAAATRAPAPAGRAPARADRDSVEKPVASEGLCAHAKRSFKSTVNAAATAVLDALITSLQWLRTRVGSTQGAEKESGEDRPRSRKDQPGGQRGATAGIVEAPMPRRRLRGLLIYLGVLLAGGAGGGVLAYDLLDREFTAGTRSATTGSKRTGPVATADEDTGEAQTAPADTEKKLEDAQTGRVDAEKKLAASLAEYAKTAAEKQRKLDETEARLETMLAAERAGTAQRASANRGSAANKPAQIKTGNCILNPGNAAALKRCLDDFNR